MFILPFVWTFLKTNKWYILFERRCFTLVCNTEVFDLSFSYILCLVQCDMIFPETKLKKLKISSNKLGCSNGKNHCGPEVTILPSS